MPIFRVIGYLNLFFLFGACLSLAWPFFSKNLHSETPISPVLLPKELPKSSFPLPEEAYLEIGEGPFSLKWIPPQMQLPDLRKELVLYGKNSRPDAGSRSCFLGLSGSQKIITAKMGEKIPLTYEGLAGEQNKTYGRANAIWGEVTETPQKGGYRFDTSGRPSSLWLEIETLSESSLEVSVHLLDENKMEVKNPRENQRFILHAQEFPKVNLIGWELGKYRADTTLFVRQKARWVGPDIFLEMHGGSEYAQCQGKQRIEFLDGTPYVCHVAENDLLVWKEDRWTLVEKGVETFGLPLLAIKKIDDKVMTTELWDAEGKGKILLTLIKTKDLAGFPDIAREFKFVGAKTWAQFIVEHGNERLILKPHDWLLLTQEGWKKIDSPETLDDYVEGRLTGPLFVLEKCVKQNGHQTLIGHVFNMQRTCVESVELSALSTPPPSLATQTRLISKIPPLQPEPHGNIE